MEGRIRELEDERDRAEREKRKRNVVIRGTDWGGGRQCRRSGGIFKGKMEN
jgi:hypothetical protein